MSRLTEHVTGNGDVQGGAAADLASRLLRHVKRGPRLWEHRDRIAFVGDCLTEGVSGASYLSLLQSRLVGHRLLNLGHAGDTVADLAARMRDTGLDGVDTVFLWVGANDAAAKPWTPWPNDPFELVSWRATLDQMSATYGRLVDWILERVPRMVCVPPIAPDGPECQWEHRVADVAELVRAATASEARVALLDLAPWFAEARAWGHVERFTIDGVHLSEEGAKVVADAFAAQVAAEAAGR